MPDDNLPDAGREGSRPLVSVLVAERNGGRQLGACLEALARQDCRRLPFEVIVHDDASDEPAAPRVHQWLPGALVLREAKGVGYNRACNRMAEVARGDYLLLLAQDATLFPNALGSLFDATRHMGVPALLSLPRYDAASGELLDCGCLLDPFANPVPNLDLLRDEVGMAPGACLWLPRELWQELGGLPPLFGDGVADGVGDAYLCCRARLAGHPVRVLPHSGYRHGSRTTPGRRPASPAGSRHLLMWVCYPPGMLWLALLRGLLLPLEGVLLGLWRMQPSLPFRVQLPAMLAPLRHLRQVRRLRRRLRCCVSGHGFAAQFVPWPRWLIMLLR